MVAGPLQDVLSMLQVGYVQGMFLVSKPVGVKACISYSIR
jgi:hypothetical protein